MIKPQQLTYEQFPESSASSEGMITIQAEFESFTRCKCTLNIEYANKNETPLNLQMIRPDYMEKERGQYPLIVFVQGSAWRKQKLGTEIAQLARIAARGYIIAIVQYRETEIEPFPAQIKDTNSAISYLVNHAKEYHIDRNNIFLWGDSSGAHTSLMVSATEDRPEFKDSDYNVDDLKINAIVDFYGVIDITTLNTDISTMDHMEATSPEGMLIGGKAIYNNLELAQATNPVQYLNENKKFPPVLIVHGGKDRLIPFSQSVYLYNSLKELNKEAILYKIAGADHGGAPFWTDQLIEIVDQFLKKYMVRI